MEFYSSGYVLRLCTNDFVVYWPTAKSILSRCENRGVDLGQVMAQVAPLYEAGLT